MKRNYEIGVIENQAPNGDYIQSFIIAYDNGQMEYAGDVVIHSPNKESDTGYVIIEEGYIYFAFNHDNSLKSIYDIGNRYKINDKEISAKLWNEYIDSKKEQDKVLTKQ